MNWLLWLRGILVIALFGWLLEALQPASTMRRYTRLVIGLLLMVAVLQPLTAIWRQRLPALTGSFWRDPAVQGLLQQGVLLQRSEQGETLAAYRREVAAAGEAAAQAVAGGAAGGVTVTLGPGDAPRAATVTLRQGESSAVQNAVRKAVATALGIAQGSVQLDSSKGGLAP